jgi:hypothetical protein
MKWELKLEKVTHKVPVRTMTIKNAKEAEGIVEEGKA